MKRIVIFCFMLVSMVIASRTYATPILLNYEYYHVFGDGIDVTSNTNMVSGWNEHAYADSGPMGDNGFQLYSGWDMSMSTEPLLAEVLWVFTPTSDTFIFSYWDDEAVLSRTGQWDEFGGDDDNGVMTRWYHVNPGQAYSISVVAGHRIAEGWFPDGVVRVPEPSTMLLFCAGLAGVVLLRKRLKS